MFKVRHIVLAMAIFAMATLTSQAQLPAGKFGVGANLSSSISGLSINYAFSNNFDLNVGLGYQSQTNEAGVYRFLINWTDRSYC